MLKRTIYEQVLDEIRKMLLTGQIRPGERIIESQMADRLNVSRGPVREALRQLSNESLVTYVPHKGCEAKLLSPDALRESYLIRSTLEGLAVSIYSGKMPDRYLKRLEKSVDDLAHAAKEKSMVDIIEADERFHSIIVEASEREKLFEMWKLLAGINISAFYTMENKDSLPYEYLERNHRWILELFQAGADASDIVEKIHEHYMVVPEELYRKDNP